MVNKLFLVLFPWRHKPWSRKQSIGPNGQEGWYLPPRDDLNSPDMYIPLMSLVTYILLQTLLAGLRGQFQPELLVATASWAFLIVSFEIGSLKLGTYLLNISNDSQLLDLVAYSGYKFVGAIVTLLVSEIVNGGKGTGGWAGWTVFIYTYLANALFLVSSYLLVHATLLTSSEATFVEIRSPPGKRQRRKEHADSCTIAKERPDQISLCILVPCSTVFPVGSYEGLN